MPPLPIAPPAPVVVVGVAEDGDTDDDRGGVALASGFAGIDVDSEGTDVADAVVVVVGGGGEDKEGGGVERFEEFAVDPPPPPPERSNVDLLSVDLGLVVAPPPPPAAV